MRLSARVFDIIPGDVQEERLHWYGFNSGREGDEFLQVGIVGRVDVETFDHWRLADARLVGLSGAKVLKLNECPVSSGFALEGLM